MIKEKDRLIAQMVATAMWTIATFNLITGGAAGIKADMIKNDIEALEQQKIECVEPSHVRILEQRIADLTKEQEKRVNFLMPSVYSFLGAGTLGSAAIAYNEIKDAKKKKEIEQEQAL